MNKFRSGLIICLTLFITCGVKTMAQTADTLTLAWQWGGEPSGQVIINVKNVTKEGAGWFGLNQSPSIAGNLPDARIVEGTIIAGGNGLMVLKIPNHELPPSAPGNLLAVAYTADHRAICVVNPPEALDQPALQDWLKNWRCVPPS